MMHHPSYFPFVKDRSIKQNITINTSLLVRVNSSKIIGEISGKTIASTKNNIRYQ